MTGLITATDELPLLLTIPEVAAILRVSRTTAYKLVDDWFASAGAEGVPAIRLRGRLFVRRVDLENLLGLG